MKKKYLSEEGCLEDGFPPLSREEQREIKLQLKESKDPVRYIVVSQILKKKYFYYIAESNCYGMDIGQSSLFKEFNVACAVCNAIDDGDSDDPHIVVKVTTKGDFIKVLKYYR